MRRLAIVLIFGIFPCSAFLPLAAQSPTATVNGQVRDTSGAVVPDAAIQLVNDRTNVHYPAKTNRDGIYSITNVPPGNYHIQVSVDSMQEFRIQTSTFAPEFGRTPGGQISTVTRSGTNQFHGSAFDFLRNDVLDATDWFRGYTHSPPLRKPEERQNDFGGTLSGPIIKNRTFFFFSYEGLRLRLPQTSLSTVPDASFTPGTTNSRQNANAAM